ncbi:DUF2169 family type VI secretion system accessory protein [Polyangium aurulentum]|uniref:DUF2169 family type VI secretion system accessory protein n=1 Tax=Polyangium aurulentum TaxID=2567896 RepID=UPI0010AE6217|nr:DUF2169 domain-containing protein [Polyangium aurulentum]UQA63170.1 DUF2169 domain-containing protein [Polyangium aurulentum]
MDFDSLCENVSWTNPGCDTSMDARGRDVLIVVAKLAYRVSPEGAPRHIVVPVRRMEQGDEGGGLRFPNDLEADEKPGTDVGLVGTAHPAARGGDQRTAYIWLSVGGLRKVVLAHGPRTYTKTWRGVVPSDPAPLTGPVPLRYDAAFGGVDPLTRASEPRNPIGRGFSSDPARLVGLPAPQLEPVAEGAAEPHPAHGAFAPIPGHWEPRRSFAGTYDAAWARSRAPVRPRDFQSRFHNWAVPGLWSATPLLGDEPFEVGGVLPEGVWRFRLPRYAVTFESVVEGRRSAHSTHLDSILIDADTRVVELTWRASFVLPKKWEKVERILVQGVGELPEEVIMPPDARRSAAAIRAGERS